MAMNSKGIKLLSKLLHPVRVAAKTAASASFLKDQALKEAQDLSEAAAENQASRKKAALRKKAVLTKNVQVVLTAIAV